MGSGRGRAYELQGGARKLTTAEEVGTGVDDRDRRRSGGRRRRRSARAPRAEEDGGGVGIGARWPRERRRTAASFGSLAASSFVFHEKWPSPKARR